MTFDELARRNVRWLDGSGDRSKLVVSSRVRLARNLRICPFPHRATEAHRQQIIETVLQACARGSTTRGMTFFEVGGLSELARHLLVERHLISPALVKRQGLRGVLVDPKGCLSVMINEEDHLRVQVILSGLRSDEAWQAASGLEEELSGLLEFARHRAWGYLTACPSNTGTGLRASVLIHLPGLVLTQEIDGVVRGITQMGFAVRGLFGEGTDAAGNMFQVSNQITLGRSESELMAMLDGVVEHLGLCEENARETLWREARAKVEDKVWRAYGLVRHARLLTSREFLNFSSALRLGLGLGILDDLSMRILNELLVETQPAHLQYLAGQHLDAPARDASRADLVRRKLT